MTIAETGRLHLRNLTDADAPFILELLNEPSFLRFIGDRGVRDLDGAVQYIGRQITSYETNGFGLWLVESKDNRAALGICGLVRRDTLPHADIGYAFLPRFWSHGYAHEAAAAVVDHARNTLGLKRLLAVTNPDNETSIRVLEKIGMKPEGMVRMTADEPEIRLFSADL